MSASILGRFSRAILGLLGLVGVLAAVVGLQTDPDGFAGNVLSEVAGILTGAALTVFVIELVRRKEDEFRDLRDTGYELAVRSGRIVGAVARGLKMTDGTVSEYEEKVEHPGELPELISRLESELDEGIILDDESLRELDRTVHDQLLGIELHCLAPIAGGSIRDRARAHGEITSLKNRFYLSDTDHSQSLHMIRDLLEGLKSFNQAAASRTPRLQAARSFGRRLAP